MPRGGLTLRTGGVKDRICASNFLQPGGHVLYIRRFIFSSRFMFPGLLLAAITGFLPARLAVGEPDRAPRSISLEQAYDLALATDQSIRIAYWEVRKANLLPWAALTRLGPQLNAGYGYTRSGATTTVPVTVATTTTTVSSTGTPSTRTEFQSFDTHGGAGSGSISFEQPLIDLTVFPAYRLGKLSARSARLQLQFTVRETLFGVATAYFEVLKQQQLVVVNRLTFELADEQLNIAQKRVDVGVVKRSDVLNAQVAVETARQTQLVASENTSSSWIKIPWPIFSISPSTPSTRSLEPPDYPTELPPFGALLDRAYGHREDLRVKYLAIDQDIERKNGVLAEYGPWRVVLQGNSLAANDTGSSALEGPNVVGRHLRPNADPHRGPARDRLPHREAPDRGDETAVRPNQEDGRGGYETGLADGANAGSYFESRPCAGRGGRAGLQAILQASYAAGEALSVDVLQRPARFE